MKRFLNTALIALTIFVAGAWLYSSLHHVSVPQTPTANVTVKADPANTLTVRHLLKAVNAEREKVGVKPLKLASYLNKSAQWKADDMAKRHYFSHYDPKTGAVNGLDYLKTLEPPCTLLSENLHESITSDTHQPAYDTTSGTVESWKGSKAHYKAMINSVYVYTGFGIDKGYVVEHFCKPI